MLNRTIEPALEEIDHIHFIAPKKYNIKGFIINIDSWNTPEIATVLHYTNITQ